MELVYTEGEFTTATTEPAAPRSPTKLIGAVALGLITLLVLIRVSSSFEKADLPQPTPTAAVTATPAAPTSIPSVVRSSEPLVTSLDNRVTADECPDGRGWNEAIASEAATEALKPTQLFGGAMSVVVLSGPRCDRIQLSIPGTTNGPPAVLDAEQGTIRLDAGPSMSRVFDGNADAMSAILTWTDMASGNANAIAIAEGADGPQVVISFGAGDVSIRAPTAGFPSLHVIDIAQNATPTGLLLGPIPFDADAPEGTGIALLTPLQVDLTGPGRQSDIPLLGVTTDPANTVIRLTPWDESVPFGPTSMSDPFPVDVRGLDESQAVTEDVREFSPPHELFEVDLLGISQGSWLLTMTLNPGTPNEKVVGQRFRVITDPGGPGASADPIPALPERAAPESTCDLPATTAFNSASVTTNFWTTPGCDRVLIILPRELDEEPAIWTDDQRGTIDINLGAVPGPSERVVWEDAATGNMNLFVLDEQADGLHAHLSYGSGEATVRRMSNPDHIEIIIRQEPWPPGMIAGPIMIRDNAPLVALSTPLQTELSGAGAEQVSLRGYTADPTNTLIEVRAWDEQWRGSPVTRNDQLNRNTLGPVVPVLVQGLTSDDEIVGSSGAFALTEQLFDLNLLDLPVGSWVITVTANADTQQEEVVGQYFRDSPESPGPLVLAIASRRGN